jgi:vacuolar-type H+-ATPase subunit I/STV1
LFSAAVEDLKELCEARNKQTAFALFEAYDLSEDERLPYAQLAAEHKIAATDLTNQLAWARREFRRLAQERLRTICVTEEEFSREARVLFGGDT